MSNKQLACIYIVCTVVQICAFVACSVPRHSEVDHRYDTPKGFYKMKPYFRNGGQILNITQLYTVKGVWHYQGKPLVIDKGSEKEFAVWVEGWQEYVAGKGNKK